MTLNRARLAQAMNDFELAADLSIVVETNLGTHRPDCIHVGWVADKYDELRRMPSGRWR